jgi:anti-anti-sigma factor
MSGSGSPSARLVWPLSIHAERCDGVLVLAPCGRLGTVSAGDLIEVIVDALTAGERLLVVDLAGVDYISSAGLLALDAVLGRLHQAGGQLVLASLSEPVRLACDFAGLLPHFDVEPAREAAIQRLRPLVAADASLDEAPGASGHREITRADG